MHGLDLDALPEDGRPLALFDLDRTLLQERTITHVADVFDVADEVQRIWDEARTQELAAGVEESRQIAALFAGVPADAFEAAIVEVPVRDDAASTVAALHDLGFRLGVVSAGYAFATRAARERLDLDLDVGVVQHVAQGRLTGTIEPPRFRGPCGQHVCKEAVLRAAAEATAAPFTVAVGDGRNDVCMLEAAALAIAIEPAHERLKAVADHVVARLDEVPALVRAAMTRAGTPRSSVGRTGRTPGPSP